MPDQPRPEDLAGGGEGEQQLALVEAAAQPTDFAERYRAARVGCAEWAQTLPGPRLLTMVMALQPVPKRLGHFLHVSSEAWEEEQLRKEADGQQSSFRVLEASHGRLLSNFCSDMSLLFAKGPIGEGSWGDILPSQHCTLGAAATAFAMLTLAAGSVFALVRDRHRAYPFKLCRP